MPRRRTVAKVEYDEDELGCGCRQLRARDRSGTQLVVDPDCTEHNADYEDEEDDDAGDD